MQAGKGAVSSVMEAAANVAASAKSGLDKTKAVLEEKVEKMSASDPVEKDMATLRKEEKIDLAEIRKKEAYEQNAAAASTGAATQGYTDGGDIPIGSQFQTSIVSTTTHAKSSTDFVPEDVVGSHYPIGTTMGVVGSEYPPETNSETGGQTHVVNPNPVSGVGSNNPTQTQTRIHTVNPDNTAVGFGSQNSSETNTGIGRSPVGDSGTGFGTGGTHS